MKGPTMKTIETEIATLNLKTGEINLYNTDKLSADDLTDFIRTLNEMREAGYKMNEDEIEQSCHGGLLKFNLLLTENAKDHHND
jgi:hypothetical protein